MTSLQPTSGPAYSGTRGRRRARSGAEPTAYDFRRPVKLSREHTRLLQVGLDGFARQIGTVFTSALRSVCSAQVTSISQTTYGEYVDTLGELSYGIKIDADPLPGLVLLDLPLTAVMSALDLMLGGPGTQEQPKRPLSEIESAVVQGLVTRLLGELAYSMAAIVDMSPSLAGIEYNPKLAQVAGSGDLVVVATLELEVKDVPHQATLCLPFNGLQPHLQRAAAPAPVSDRERIQRDRAAELVDRRFQDVPVDAVVRFTPTRLDPGTLSNLAVGDVVRLAHRAAAPLDVVVGEATFAHATAGTHGTRLAALVVGTTKENA